MKHKTQDPRFWIGVDDNSTPVLIGQDGPVPADEPLFILRARDINAVRTLLAYRDAAKSGGANQEHLHAIELRISQFSKFSFENPERMKVPDTSIKELHDGKPS